MSEVSIIGMDLAKRVFQVHGALPDGNVAFRKKLSRSQFMKFLSEQPPCLIAMEACATAHYWGREALEAGHEVRLIPRFTSNLLLSDKRMMLLTRKRLWKRHYGQPCGLSK